MTFCCCHIWLVDINYVQCMPIPLVKHGHIRYVPYNHEVIWGGCCYVRSFRSPCCAQSGAMLLLLPASLSRTATATKALRAARSQHHSEEIKIPSFLCPLFFMSNPLFSSQSAFSAPHAANKGTHTRTHNFNLLSAVRVIITQYQRETRKEER